MSPPEILEGASDDDEHPPWFGERLRDAHLEMNPHLLETLP